MSVGQKNAVKVVSQKGFQAVGLKWEGTFEEAFGGAIRKIQDEMHQRLAEIPHVVDSEVLLGLSYHASLGGTGFTHYAAVEVDKVEDLPDGMVAVSVPELTYAQTEHNKGQSVKHSYDNIYVWIRSEGYQEDNTDGLTHYERYPMSQNPYDENPEFTIRIPVKK